MSRDAGTATHDLAFAMALAPHDADTCAVYADSLGSDPLGEFIAIHCRLEKTPDAADRRLLVAAERTLWRQHATEWLARWNTPTRVFPQRPVMFCGLPSEAQIVVLDHVDALEAQLARLPIQCLDVTLSAADLETLCTLPVLQRVSRIILGGRVHELEGVIAPCLARAKPSRLQDVVVSSTNLSADELRVLAETCAALRRLTVFDCGITNDAVRALAETAAAERLECLKLAYNEIDGAVLPALAKLARLRELSLMRTSVGDEVSATSELPVEVLDLCDCERLTPAVFATLVRAMPALAELAVSTLEAGQIDALRPIAGQLKGLTLDWSPLEATAAIVHGLFDRAVGLETFAAQEATNLAGAIVAHTMLRDLSIRGVTDDDVLAIAGSPNVRAMTRLDLDGELGDHALVALAGSPHLQQLRALRLKSPTIGTRAIAAVLAMPNLESLTFGALAIEDERPFLERPADMCLSLSTARIDDDKLARLQAHWGSLL